jgi:uncharacterized membrane protein
LAARCGSAVFSTTGAARSATFRPEGFAPFQSSQSLTSLVGVAKLEEVQRALMSDLIVIGFPNVEEAEQVRRELVTIQQQHLIALEDACVLEHGEDGHVHLKQAINLAAAGAASGSFWGMLIGLLFLNPLVGLAVGAGAGAASGALSDIGINDQFLKELGETLPKGSAALALLVREGTPDRVVESLRSHAPHARLVKTSLSHVDEDKLRELIKTSAQQAEALRLA